MKPPHLFFQAVEAWAAGLRPQRTELADSEIVGWTDEGVVEVLVEASHAAWCVQHEAQIRQRLVHALQPNETLRAAQPPPVSEVRCLPSDAAGRAAARLAQDALRYAWEAAPD